MRREEVALNNSISSPWVILTALHHREGIDTMLRVLLGGFSLDCKFNFRCHFCIFHALSPSVSDLHGTARGLDLPSIYSRPII